MYAQHVFDAAAVSKLNYDYKKDKSVLSNVYVNIGVTCERKECVGSILKDY